MEQMTCMYCDHISPGRTRLRLSDGVSSGIWLCRFKQWRAHFAAARSARPYNHHLEALRYPGGVRTQPAPAPRPYCRLCASVAAAAAPPPTLLQLGERLLGRPFISACCRRGSAAGGADPVLAGFTGGPNATVGPLALLISIRGA